VSRRILVAISLLAIPVAAAAYQADLVPASGRPEARDITGTLSIKGADGMVHVKISSVNDAAGDPLDSDKMSVRLRVRTNGIRRRVTIPLTVDGGDGDATESLGLQASDRLIVEDVRVRGPDGHTLAEAGLITVDDTGSGPTPPAPTPPPSDCPDALASCQSDLDDCNSELDDCESQ
jgi:hypothetical protein